MNIQTNSEAAVNDVHETVRKYGILVSILKIFLAAGISSFVLVMPSMTQQIMYMIAGYVVIDASYMATKSMNDGAE